MRYQNIDSIFYSFVTKHAFDGQTDGQNYDPQDRAIIAASRGKNASGVKQFPALVSWMEITHQQQCAAAADDDDDGGDGAYVAVWARLQWCRRLHHAVFSNWS